jgi:hypothetical protein
MYAQMGERRIEEAIAGGRMSGETAGVTDEGPSRLVRILPIR